MFTLLAAGETATFECSVAGEESASVTWLKDNKPLSDRLMDRVSKSNVDNAFKLEIQNLIEADTGMYTAHATNAEGSSTCTAHLLVQKLTDEERKQRAEANHPVFLVKLKDTELLENTYLRFMVKVKGNPNPTVRFYKDDSRILSTNDRLKVNTEQSDAGYYELVIPEVKPEDAGKYSCVAINSYGEERCDAQLSVVDEKDVFAGLEEGEEVAPGQAPTFHWTRNGQQFDPEERFKVLLTAQRQEEQCLQRIEGAFITGDERQERWEMDFERESEGGIQSPEDTVGGIIRIQSPEDTVGGIKSPESAEEGKGRQDLQQGPQQGGLQVPLDPTARQIKTIAFAKYAQARKLSVLEKRINAFRKREEGDAFEGDDVEERTEEDENERLQAGGQDSEGGDERVRMEEREFQRLREIEKEKEVERLRQLEIDKMTERLKEEERGAEIEKQKEIERQKEVEKQKEVERLKRKEEQKRLEKQKEIEKQIEQDRLKEFEKQKEIERQREIEKQKEIERQKEVEKQREIERQKEIEKQREIERQKEIEKQKEIERQK
ncbi:trichohyalin-like, partial [Frankliniella occidentalis]|uniref:Trichohyalin-like n=1 Tax=Frankliniella occidentalis TaxID=133901 RepID=A0A9C6XVL7_FRAOC